MNQKELEIKLVLLKSRFLQFSFLNVSPIMHTQCKEMETLVVSLRVMTLNETLSTRPPLTTSQSIVVSLRLSGHTSHASDR